MSEVIRHNKLDISSLHYSKPVNQNNLYYGSIDYNNNPCYIQTAKLVVEDIKEVNKQKYIVLKVDPDDFSFYDLLVKLDDHNLSSTYKFSKDWFSKELPMDILEKMTEFSIVHPRGLVSPTTKCCSILLFIARILFTKSFPFSLQLA